VESLFGAACVSPSFLVRFRVRVPLVRLKIHHGLNGAFTLAMQGEACKIIFSGGHSLKVWQAPCCSMLEIKQDVIS